MLATPWLLGCPDWFHTGFDDIEPAAAYTAANVVTPEQTPDTLKVVTWNIKFGAGRVDVFFECHGDRVLIAADEVDAHLTAIAEWIRAEDPDVILLQEVDRNSRRTAWVDMVQWLLDRTDLNYGVYASMWKADFIPSDGIGRIDTGQAILSRWPLSDGTRIALPEVSEFDALRSYFYLKRNMLRVNLTVGDAMVTVIDVHTEAFSPDGTKGKQIGVFREELVRLDGEGIRFVAGGDLNAVPPSAEKKQGFPDSKCPPDGDFDGDDYTGDDEHMTPLYATGFTPAIPEDEAGGPEHGTHTTDKAGFWNRKLDYLFTNMDKVDGSGVTHQLGTMPLSDHAPVSFEVTL